MKQITLDFDTYTSELVREERRGFLFGIRHAYGIIKDLRAGQILDIDELETPLIEDLLRLEGKSKEQAFGIQEEEK